MRMAGRRAILQYACIYWRFTPSGVCLEVVPGEGVEPSCPCGREILSLVRLPFRHPGVEGASL